MLPCPCPQKSHRAAVTILDTVPSQTTTPYLGTHLRALEPPGPSDLPFSTGSRAPPAQPPPSETFAPPRAQPLGTPQEARSGAGLSKGLPTLTVDCDPSLAVEKRFCGNSESWAWCGVCACRGCRVTGTKSCEERKLRKKKSEREKTKRTLLITCLVTAYDGTDVALTVFAVSQDSEGGGPHQPTVQGGRPKLGLGSYTA